MNPIQVVKVYKLMENLKEVLTSFANISLTVRLQLVVNIYIDSTS